MSTPITAATRPPEPATRPAPAPATAPATAPAPTPILLDGGVMEVYMKTETIESFDRDATSIALVLDESKMYNDGELVFVCATADGSPRIFGALRHAPNDLNARGTTWISGTRDPWKFTAIMDVIAWFDPADDSDYNSNSKIREFIEEDWKMKQAERDAEGPRLTTIIVEPFVWWSAWHAARSQDDVNDHDKWNIDRIVSYLRRASRASAAGATVYAAYSSAVAQIKLAETRVELDLVGRKRRRIDTDTTPAPDTVTPLASTK